MRRFPLIPSLSVCLLGLMLAAGNPGQAQTLHLLQAVPLRADRQPGADALAQLAMGQAVELLQLSGGWAQVQARGTGAARRGWVRAGLLDMAGAEAGAASRLDTGPLASGTAGVVPLRIRALPPLPPRATRHALIVGIGQYQADVARPVPALAGVQHDMASALAMARQLQVPADNITLLRDAGATRDAVRQALADLAVRVQPGDRVFVYWSGHGSRYLDPVEGGCVETLVPHDLKDIGNRQFAQWLRPVASKVDKLLVVYDACHSGGVGAASNMASAAPSRSAGPTWTPKTAAPGNAACTQPSNMRSRSFDSAARGLGLDGQDVVHLSSSRPDEVSFDNAATGGLATDALRHCLQGEARDLDGSGAISMDELAACAQGRIERALAGQAQLLPHHLVLSGNRGFVPAWFAAPTGLPAPSVTALGPFPDAAVSTPVPAPVAQHRPPATATVQPSAPPASAPAVPLRQVLAQINDQRDSKRRVGVLATLDRLRIGRDALDLAVTSSHAGHVYMALLGSDRQSLTLLFPNALDGDNRIAAGQTLLLPRAGWRVAAGGPAGEDLLLVMVTDGPRDLSLLGGGQAGPFALPLTDAGGRTRLQWLLGQRAPGCTGSSCSDAFGSALLKIEEY